MTFLIFQIRVHRQPPASDSTGHDYEREERGDDRQARHQGKSKFL